MPEQFDRAFRNAHRISPSQTETYELCRRKWAFEKIEKRPKPPNKYAETGLEAHGVLELWQRDGRAIDLSTPIGKIVAPGLKFLPQPGTHRTEHNFIFDTGRVMFHGRMDLRGQLTDRVQTVWDHKTTSSFNWLKTPEVLRRDAQAVIYAKATLEEAKRHGLSLGFALDCIELNWIYYLVNPERPRSRKVQLNVVRDEHSRKPQCPSDVRPEHFGVMTLEELEQRFAEIEEIGVEMLSHFYNKVKATDLPYNIAGCGAFGGCPYRDNPCTLTLAERIDAMEAKNEATNLTLAQKIQQNMAAASTGAVAQPQTTGATAPAAAPISPTADPPVPVAGQQGGTEGGGLSLPALNRIAQQPASPPRQEEQPAQVNPPEKAKGVDPDGPAQVSGKGNSVTRAEMAKDAMRALIRARVYSIDDNRYEAKLSAQAVRLADTMFAALAK
jgi:hypothetical protein